MAVDAGDLVFGAAANNDVPSGPGGVTRDRAIDLARQLQAQGVSPLEAASRAIAQAQQETSTGANPRDPGRGGAAQTAGAPAQTAASVGAANAPATGPSFTDLLLSTRKPVALIAGVPNAALAVGLLLLLRRR